jgi:superfamily II DNA or RNA helicase
MTAPAPTAVTPYLRRWQIRALQGYLEAGPRDYLVTATPGSGKTTFALTLAGRLLAQRIVQRVIVVVPTFRIVTMLPEMLATAGSELS